MATYTNLDEDKLETTAQPISAADHLVQYNNAIGKLAQVKQNLPTYDKSHDQALQDLFDEIAGYEKFSYNTREDSLYQAYKQSYTNAGKLAMQDTMGQAAALTGGYGSSYGQAVGQQQYHAYLQKLNDVLPETYGMAYQQYQDERGALVDRYNMTGQLAESEYQKYQDRLNAYYREMDYWQNTADTAYGRYQQAEEQAYQREQDAYAKQQDAYDRLVDMIVTTGYTPDAEDLAAAGMKDSQYQAYLNYYNSMNAGSAGGSGGGGRRSSKKKTDEEDGNYNLLLDQAKDLIDRGVSAEVLNGSLSSNAGGKGLTVDQTRKIMLDITDYNTAKNKKGRK